ncbi:lipid II flippase Amj family protein [Paenibacillus filicis]|uniref:Lipid II flippase Amj n=1 Tax=Paenibacillus filicis TaxID=669464 RepID=A0ABU9DPV8_9BACL
MLDTLLMVCLLTLAIHTAETLSYAIRLAGVRAGKLAVALSLTGIVVLVSRTANMIQAPLTANLIDQAKQDAAFPLDLYFRYILGASSVGTLLAILLFPTFVFLFARVIVHLEIEGSIPRLITSVTVDKLKHAAHHVRKPRLAMLHSLRYYGIPKRLLLINMVVTSVYTVGVLSALYAAYLVPAVSLTASQSSGLINGVATILLTIFVDPRLALITDKAIARPEERGKLGRIFGMLMISRLAGTLLAQVIFIPAAYWVSTVAQWL